ncbi:CTP synthase [Candidatus Microgenomates bacterium]|nr:CTP synthase [Candidatus Microgenomates bacterium]
MRQKQPTKYLFVTGGVSSGIGKGIAAASLAKILKSRGLKVNLQKCDPYLNTDAGTLNPGEHGEVFVTADGAETDLDLGHYERFLDQELDQRSSTMNGAILGQVIADERAGKYLGKTVQIIPHVTNAIADAIARAGEGFDIHIVEIGGTVGDYESLAFLEAIRTFKYRVGPENVLYINVVYLPYLKASQELKTKPAQNAVRSLRSIGIQPDILLARAEYPVHEKIIHKLSMYCDVPTQAVIPMMTAKSVYAVPLQLEATGVGDFITERLNLGRRRANLRTWKQLVTTATNPDLPKLRIGIVAKYLDHQDTYMSVCEAIKAATWQAGYQPQIIWVSAEELGANAQLIKQLATMDGLIVPGGFGKRGIEGKIRAADYAMKTGVPYLGLCLGMQIAVIALARRMVSPEANSTEFDPKTRHPVISLMADQTVVTDLGGTMRLGNYPCVLAANSLARRLYGRRRITERHRHRYEFNNAYRQVLTRHGLELVGLSPDGRLVEVIELKGHPFFVASQFHPEFKSRLTRPHPLFAGFVQAAINRQGQSSQSARHRLAASHR